MLAADVNRVKALAGFTDTSWMHHPRRFGSFSIAALLRRFGDGQDGDNQTIHNVYQALVHGRPEMAADSIAALVASKPSLRDGLLAQAWADLLAGSHPATLGDIANPPALMVAFAQLADGRVPTIDELTEAIGADPIGPPTVVAIELMHRTEQLEAVAARLSADAVGVTRAARLHRLTLDFGLVRPQQILNDVVIGAVPRD